MNTHKIALTLAAASALLTACDSDDNWQPGPQDPDAGVAAYFPDQTTSLILSPLDPLQITTTIKRVDTASEVTIPLEVTCTASGLEYPESVTFAAGQDEVTYVIDCSGLPTGEFQTVTITLPDDQTDIYGPGMPSLSLSVIVSEWKLLSEDVSYDFSNGWDKVTGEKMYILDNTKYVRLTNFFGSGIDMMTEITTTSGQYFTPMNNAVWDTDDDYNVWYLYDEAKDEYPVWYPAGKDNPGIQYFYIYTDSYSKIYLLSNPDTMYGYAYLGGYLYYDTGDWSDWLYMYIKFHLLFNPF